MRRALLGVLIICAFLLVALAVQQFPKGVPNGGNNATESNAGVGPNRALPYYLGPLIIHSVDYSNMIIGQQLVVPDSSVIGPGYKLAGVLVNSIPHAVTNDVGITTNDWMVTFILSDK